MQNISFRVRVAVVTGLLIAAFFVSGGVRTIKERVPVNNSKSASVARYVFDGDTVELGNGERVRLLGMNTPERGQPYANVATDALRELVAGAEVRLEKDITDRDIYGRLLRYVWVGDILLNLEMVKRGYANSYTVPPDVKHQEEILQAERGARESRLGLWALSPHWELIDVMELHADAEGNDNTNLNGEYVILKNVGDKPIGVKAWTLKNEGTQIFTFPRGTLYPNTAVTLYSGSGTNGNGKLYWNRTEKKYPVWNNKGGVFYLRDAEGLLVLEYHY